MSVAWTRYLGYGRESSYGTAATITRRIDILSESMTHQSRRRDIDSERSGGLDRVVETEQGADGTVDVLPDWTTLGDWLAHLMGTPTTTTPATGAKRHEWLHSMSYRPGSLTLDLHPDVRVHRFLGAVGRSLRIGTEAGRHLALAIGMLAQQEVDGGTIPTVAESSFGSPLAVGSPGGPSFSATLAIDGVSASALGTLNLDFAWARTLRRVERSLVPVGIIDKKRVTISGSLRWRFDDTTTSRHDAWKDLSQLSLTATWTGTLISGSTYRTLEIHLPNCIITGSRGTQVRGAGGSGTLELDTQFVARTDSDLSGSPYRVRLTNTVANPASF